jgi:cytochrome c biogenesis protein CcmG/thiol:disulfide interchange protein DsbE
MSAAPAGNIRLIYFLPVLVFAFIAGIAAVFMLSGKDPRQVGSNLVGKPAPEFSLPALPGQVAGLSRKDLSGKVTVVNFFASWCAPCLIEHPFLMTLRNRPGIRLVGINYKDKPKDAVAWLKRHGNPYARIGADVSGRVGIDWGLSGVPETFIVDRAGIVRFQHIGPLTPDVIKNKLMPALQAITN